MWRMGSLHIDTAFFSAIVDRLEVCGQTELNTNINTLGGVESLLDGGKVGKSRYAHQISLAIY